MNQKRLSFATKSGYGLGQAAISVHDTAFNTFILFYYTQVLGLAGSIAGTAIAVGLCFDAVTDPLMGYFSDNFRSRFGRRHPFMALSVLPLAASVYVLFTPASGLGEIGLFVWMMVSIVVVRAFYTVFAVPYLALGAEITEDYVQRTTVSTYRIATGWLVGIITVVVAYTVFFPKTEEFKLGQMNPAGYSGFGLFCAVLIAISAAACIFLTRKEIPRLLAPAGDSGPVGIVEFFGSLKLVLGNHSFRIFFLTAVVAGVIIGVSMTLGLHMNTYFWELNSEDLALLMSSMLISSVLAFTLLKWLEHYDKKKTFIALFWSFVFGQFLVVLRLFDLLPPNGSRLLFILIYLQLTFFATLAIMVMAIMSSILADTVDEGELESHIRQEGLYFAFLNFGTKINIAVGALLAGLIIDFIGLPANVAPEHVDPDVIWNLGFFCGPIFGISWLVPILIMSRLRLTRERMVEIRGELDARKDLLQI